MSCKNPLWQSWNGPRPKPISPGSILGPHYIRQKPDVALARFAPKPTSFSVSPRGLDYKH